MVFVVSQLTVTGSLCALTLLEAEVVVGAAKQGKEVKRQHEVSALGDEPLEIFLFGGGLLEERSLWLGPIGIRLNSLI